MPDHLSAIGFQINTVDAFESLAHMAVEYGTPFLSEHGSYIHWNWGQAIEFWVQADKTLQLTGCHPFFNANRSTTWQIEQWIADPTHPLDGLLIAVPHNDDNHTKWLMQVPDFNRHQHQRQTAQLNVAMFIHTIDFLDDDASNALAYTATTNTTDEASYVASHAKITARIKRSTLEQNKVSKGRFWHLVLETSAGLIDAVCASKIMKKRPRVGATVNVEAWITARPIDSEDAP